MDAHHFDSLTKRLSQPGSRRTALGGVVASVLIPLEAAARGKRHQRKKHKSQASTSQARAQAEPCWRAGACIPRTGSNVSRCDLAGSTAFRNLDCTGCNVSRANLSGIDARNANFTRANLSGSCLINADFTGATFASTTNLSGAIFCNTKMPNGSVNTSGCGSGTACCGTCTPSCANKACGADDGCGGTCQTGSCSGGLTCNAGLCIASQGTCPAGGDYCLSNVPIGCNGNGDCQCQTTWEGTTACTSGVDIGGRCGGCQSSADCAQQFPTIPGVVCIKPSEDGCCRPSVFGGGGYCIDPCPASVIT